MGPNAQPTAASASFHPWTERARAEVVLVGAVKPKTNLQTEVLGASSLLYNRFNIQVKFKDTVFPKANPFLTNEERTPHPPIQLQGTCGFDPTGIRLLCI